MWVYDDFFTESLTKSADQSVKTDIKAQSSSDAWAFNAGNEQRSKDQKNLDRLFQDDYKPDIKEESNLESIGWFLWTMKSQIKWAWKAIWDTYDLYVHDKSEDRWIYDLSKYKEYSAKIEQYKDSWNLEEAQRYYNKMTDEWIVDYDKLQKYQKQEQITNADENKVSDYKDNLTKKYIDSVKDNIKNNKDSFTQEIITEWASQMSDQLSDMYSTIQSSYETNWFSKADWENKLKSIEDKVWVFYSWFVEWLKDSTDDEEVYNKLLSQDKYKKLAKEISDFNLELRDASVQASMDYFKWVASEWNPIQAIGSNFMRWSNFISDVINKIGWNSLETWKQELWWGYDVTEELSHLNVYKEWSSHLMWSVNYYKDELIDWLPQFLPELASMFWWAKILSKAWEISKFTKLIDEINNPYLKKMAVWWAELSKDILMYDIIWRGMLDRWTTSSDVASDLLISWWINSIIWMMASTAWKQNQVYKDLLDQYSVKPKYLDDEVIDLFKAGKINEWFALSLKRWIDWKEWNVLIHSKNDADHYRSFLDSKAKNISKWIITDSDNVVLDSVRKSTNRKYSDADAIKLYKNNINILWNIKTAWVKWNKDITSKQTISIVNNALNDKLISKESVNNLIDSASDAVYSNPMSSVKFNINDWESVSLDNIKDLVKFYLWWSDVNPIKQLKNPDSRSLSILTNWATEVLDTIRRSNDFLNIIPNWWIIWKFRKTETWFTDLVTWTNVWKWMMQAWNKNWVNQSVDIYNKLDTMLKLEPNATIFDVSEWLNISWFIKWEWIKDVAVANSVLHKAISWLWIKFEWGKLLAHRNKIKKILRTIKEFNQWSIPVSSLSKEDYSTIQLMFMKDAYRNFENKYFLYWEKLPTSEITYKAFKQSSMFRLWEPVKIDWWATVYKINLKRWNPENTEKYIKNILKSNISADKKTNLIWRFKTLHDATNELFKWKKMNTIVKEHIDNFNFLKKEENKPFRNKIDKSIDKIEKNYIEEWNIEESALVTTELIESNALTPSTLNTISTGNMRIQMDFIDDVANTELLKNSKTRNIVKNNVVKNKLNDEVKSVAQKVEKNKMNSDGNCYIF